MFPILTAARSSALGEGAPRWCPTRTPKRIAPNRRWLPRPRRTRTADPESRRRPRRGSAAPANRLVPALRCRGSSRNTPLDDTWFESQPPMIITSAPSADRHRARYRLRQQPFRVDRLDPGASIALRRADGTATDLRLGDPDDLMSAIVATVTPTSSATANTRRRRTRTDDRLAASRRLEPCVDDTRTVIGS